MEETVLIDTREKKAYSFHDTDVVRTGLETGDYTIDGFEDVFAVERKSLDDLATTLGQGRERFEEELTRAENFEEFVVVIEAEKSMLYDRNSRGECPHYYSNIHPNAIIGTVEKWPKKYDTLEFEWAGDRDGAKDLTLQLLEEWYEEYSDRIC